MLLGGSCVALLWNAIDTGEVSHALVSDTRRVDGARPLPYYRVFKAFHEHFGPGTRLYAVTTGSSSDHSSGVEALASDKQILLINTRDKPVTVSVRVNGRGGCGRSSATPYVPMPSLALAAWEVRLAPL
jgi:hypothetical protein